MTVALLDANELPGLAPQGSASTPHVVVVLVSPRGGLSSCRSAIARLTSGGAAVYAEEVESVYPKLDADCAALSDVVWTIGTTLDRATKEFPGLPVVLIGHASTGAGALAFAELYPGGCEALVLTQKAAA
jgi:pimeloyl-ACP methyl ester carboxylesterase